MNDLRGRRPSGHGPYRQITLEMHANRYHGKCHRPNEGVSIMRALKPAVSAIGIALALGLAGPGAAQPQQNTFNLKVCNASGKDVILALAHRVSANPSETRFVVRGWVAMQQGCGE